MFSNTLAKDFTYKLNSRKMAICIHLVIQQKKVDELVIGNYKIKWFDGVVAPKIVDIISTEDDGVVEEKNVFNKNVYVVCRVF